MPGLDNPSVLFGEASFVAIFHQALSFAHSSAGVLLFLLALVSVLISVLIAVKPAADHANEELVSKANTVGRVQQVFVGIVTLTGVIAALMGPWTFSQFWLWSSLAVMAFYVVALEFVTKPARIAVADGGSEGKVGLQVGLQVAHVLLLMVAIASMVVKPI